MLRAVWIVWQTLPGWRGMTQREPLATLCLLKRSEVTTPAVLQLSLPAVYQISSAGHFTPSTSLPSTNTATVITAPPLRLKQVLNNILCCQYANLKVNYMTELTSEKFSLNFRCVGKSRASVRNYSYQWSQIINNTMAILYYHAKYVLFHVTFTGVA